MAETGELWIKSVAEAQEFKVEKIGTEDLFLKKDIIGLVVEEKDWKDPVKVSFNNIYQRGINGKWYRHNKGQVVKYAFEIKQRDMNKKIYRHIISVYVFSNLMGRRVQPIYYRKYGTVFVVSKEYFPAWLHSLERTYLGEISLDSPNMYMGAIR